MAVDEVQGQAWTRKHDDPASALLAGVPRTMFPTSLEDVIEICVTRPPAERIRTAGSHWSLSGAAVSDNTFVETHDPNNAHQAMGRTLLEVVPGCLAPEFIAEMASRQPGKFDAATAVENDGLYPVHIETGKRVYQLYAELDQGDDNNPRSLAVLLANDYGNAHYLGPWGFQTLGGAGGQTVFGALTTGTHGGDFRFPPIADAVMALHLVADGGRHYWIEPESVDRSLGVRLTDAAALRAVYGQDIYRGALARGDDNFAIIRDNNLFYSVLVGLGRFGIVYSIVLAAVRQYSLREQRRLTTWQEVRGKIGDRSSDLYRGETPQGPVDSRFLQVGICLTPHENFTKNLCGVTKRWNVPLATAPGQAAPAGRAQRVGPVDLAFDPLLQAPRFRFAGNSHTYVPEGQELSFLSRACSNASFVIGILEVVAEEIKKFIDSNGAVIGAAIAAVVVVGGPLLLPLLAALAVLLPILLLLIAALVALAATAVRPTLGDTLANVADTLLNRADPNERAAGIFIWQMIAFEIFKSQQNDFEYAAISYAVMDKWDYLDRSCNVNVDSIEVFFDAKNPTMLVAFIDALIAFEIFQEANGRAFVGFASMRFMGKTRATIGMQQHEETCGVEVAGFSAVNGTNALVDFAVSLALDPAFNATLHWGQRNDSRRINVERRFGDRASAPVGPLRRWRAALSRITENGKLDGFSSAFTRRTGLEIVTPRIEALSMSAPSSVGQPLVIDWDCDKNPPNAAVNLTIVGPSGVLSSLSALPLNGRRQVAAPQPGAYTAHLVAAIDLGGERREVTQSVSATVT